MKKILYLCLSALLLFSCTTGVDDIFDDPASERLSARLNECRTLLTSAPNGWLISYFPATTREFGGYNYVAKFNTDGFVEVCAEIAVDFDYDLSEAATSHYSLNGSSSVMLTFDTYNKYLHYFSDPDFYGGNAFGGDFEFVYSSGDANRMIFQGGKTGNTIVFTAIEEGRNRVDVLRTIVEQKKNVEELFFANFRWEDNTGNIVSLQLSDEYNILLYNVGSTQNRIPFIYTPTGMLFYEPVTLGGVTVRQFDWETSGKRYVSADATTAAGSPASIVLTGSKSDTFIAYNDLIGQWKLFFESGSSYVNVVLSEKVRNKTLLMTGLGYEMEVEYHKMGSYISLHTQLLEGNSIYLCAWDGDRGYYTPSSGVGINFTFDPHSSATELIATDNGAWPGYNVNSFLIADISGPVYLGQIPMVTKLSK